MLSGGPCHAVGNSLMALRRNEGAGGQMCGRLDYRRRAGLRPAPGTLFRRNATSSVRVYLLRTWEIPIPSFLRGTPRECARESGTGRRRQGGCSIDSSTSDAMRTRPQSSHGLLWVSVSPSDRHLLTGGRSFLALRIIIGLCSAQSTAAPLSRRRRCATRSRRRSCRAGGAAAG